MSHARIVRYFKTSPEIIRLAVIRVVRYPLSLRNVEDLLNAWGTGIAGSAHQRSQFVGGFPEFPDQQILARRRHALADGRNR